MDVFEFAMKMEDDGRQYYLSHAEKTSNPSLKNILLELADDELRHYNIFKSMKNNEEAKYDDSQKTTIIGTVKTVFEQLKEKDSDYKFGGDFIDVWKKAVTIEKDAEKFYRKKAGELKDANQKNILNKIADEEHNHWVTLENVVHFLERPQTWLEDAEWNNLETY
ncbi:MAG: ferritin family protein [Candidatus Zixiibacteriota bacterium]